MPKRTNKPLAYVEPPPTADSSDPGRGVWSDTSGIAVTRTPGGTLLQAIYHALRQLPPDVAETIPLTALPSALQFDAWTATRLRLESPWWQAGRWARRILGAAGHADLSEESLPAQPVIVGTAELHAEKCWRFDPGYQPRDVVREGILRDFTRELDRELDAAYATIKLMRPRPSSRPNLARDAWRYVLREFLQLSDANIWDCEREGEWILDKGRTVKCPYQKPDNAEAPEAYREKRKQNREQALDAIDHSIRHFARDAGLTVSPQRRGRPPDPESDRKLKQGRKQGNRRS